MAAKKITLIPLEVSPLIKLMRWSSLISGAIYGFLRQRKYATLENIRREREEEKRPAREALLAREKLQRDIIEMRELEKIFLGTGSIDENTTFNET